MIRVKSSIFGAVILAATACGGSVETTPHDSSSATSTGGGGQGGGGTTTSTSTTSTSSTGGIGGGGGALPIDTITLSGKVVRSPNGSLLPGVTVCVYAAPSIPCVQTDAQAEFSIPVPTYTETGVTLEKEGSGAVLLPFSTNGTDLSGWTIGMPATAAIEGFYSAANIVYPSIASGFLQVWIDQGTTEVGIEGVAISMSPASGNGPLYAASGGTAPDPALQATSAAGFARFALVTPGVVAVDVAPGALTCKIRFGGWPNGPTSLRAPIVAGFETHVSFGCK